MFRSTFVAQAYKRVKHFFILTSINDMIAGLQRGDYRSIARCITLVENGLEGSRDLLLQLPSGSTTPVIGITGPPGAGKSTLVNALLKAWVDQGKKIAVVSVDPSSPFNYGALLGDRIRMSAFYLHPDVYIRSLASRGSLGGLSAGILEVLDVLRVCPFDVILVETVGVGQSEVEIAGIADTTIVVTVPEAGDEVQTMKAGVMEIADIFVVNKGDRANADEFVKNLKLLAHGRGGDWEIPVVKCIATSGEGIEELIAAISMHHAKVHVSNDRQLHLLADKAFWLIQQKRMKDVSRSFLEKRLASEKLRPDFNLYRFVEEFS